MSETKAPSQQLVVVLADKLAALDQFAEENSLALLTDNKGGFTAAIAMADAIGQLKLMLTDDIMRPFMALQGTSLGFKTDRDALKERDPWYDVNTVRDVLIEATIKGFKLVGNQVNIIGGRFYATKEGFENWFLQNARAGKITDLDVKLSVPKIIAENEAHVTGTISWKHDGAAEKIENVVIPIRINKGQGADAILGKARRKLLQQAHSKITGTIVTDGEIGDADAINVETRPVTDPAAQPGAAATPLTDEQKQLLKEIVGTNGDKANAFLRSQGSIKADQTFLDLKPKAASSIIGRSKDFLNAIGA